MPPEERLIPLQGPRHIQPWWDRTLTVENSIRQWYIVHRRVPDEIGNSEEGFDDGENHEGGVEDACEAAVDKGIKIYTIGMDLSQGVRIPLRNDAYNRDFRRDNEGNFVITRLNEQMLKDIAAVGNGHYYRANSPNMGLNEMLAQLNNLDKAEMDYSEYTEYEEQFPVLVWLALALLGLEYMVLDRKNRWLKKIRVFN